MTRVQWFGALLGTAVLAIFLLLPPIDPITEVGMKTAGIFFFVVIWWVFVDIGFSSFLCIALFPLTGVMSPASAFSVSLGHWIIIFLIGCFGLAEAIRISGFSHRFALWFLSRSFTRGRPWALLTLFCLGVTIMGAFMSTTVTVILFLSLIAPLLEGMGYRKGDPFPAMLIMGIAWVALSSFVMTPIGHASNLLCMEWVLRDTGYSITFPGWLIVGLPVGLLLFGLLMVFFRYVIRPDVNKFSEMTDIYIQRELTKLEPMKPGEKASLLVFGAVVLCWMLPSIGQGLVPGISAYLEKMGYAVPALVGACVLCLLRFQDKPLLTFQHWMSGVEWGSVVLVAAIMLIGDNIGRPETGIPQLLTGAIVPVVGGAPFLLVVLMAVTWVVLQTNAMSNIVSATLVYTVMMPAIITAGVGNAPAFGFTVFASCHYAFCLPSATVVTAIVVGSGWVPVGFMARYGLMMIVPIILLLTFVCYPLAALIYR